MAKEIRATYQERDYKLFGRFKKEHVITSDNERKYQTLKTYEEQCQELQEEIKQLENCFGQKSKRVDQLREEIKRAEIRLQHYCEKEEYYKKLEKDNELLKQEKVQLQSERQWLKEQSDHLCEERDAAKEETKTLKNRTWWQRLLNK